MKKFLVKFSVNLNITFLFSIGNHLLINFTLNIEQRIIKFIQGAPESLLTMLSGKLLNSWGNLLNFHSKLLSGDLPIESFLEHPVDAVLHFYSWFSFDTGLTESAKVCLHLLPPSSSHAKIIWEATFVYIPPAHKYSNQFQLMVSSQLTCTQPEMGGNKCKETLSWFCLCLRLSL